MDSLTEVLIQELDKYAGRGANATALPLYDREHQYYAIAIIDMPKRKQPADLAILARVSDEKIIIEEDTTDNPLIDALLQQGVPRDKIVLAYAGEIVPEALPS